MEEAAEEAEEATPTPRSIGGFMTLALNPRAKSKFAPIIVHADPQDDNSPVQEVMPRWFECTRKPFKTELLYYHSKLPSKAELLASKELPTPIIIAT